MPLNSVITLLAGGQSTPEGWGFPPTAATQFPQSKLRQQLMFLQDEDGRAQLIRWYHGLIRSYPPVWRTLASEHEGYQPSMMYRPCIYSHGFNFCRDPRTGAMLLNWCPGPEITSLTGVLDFTDRPVLSLAGKNYVLQSAVDPDTGRTAVVWPAFLGLQAGVISPPSESHSVVFRPQRFDATALCQRLLDNLVPDLESSGLLPAFLSLPRPEDKLAVAWLAVSTIET